MSLLFAAMSKAQASVMPGTTPASGASTSLCASSVVNVAEDGIQYETVPNYKKEMPAGYDMAKEAVDKGVGIWGRTNITLLNPHLK